MDGVDDERSCARQLHVDDAGSVEAGLVCSCAAGLIHMHDCPIALGQSCMHFEASGEEAEALALKEYEEVRGRLMADYLSRAYYHRVRSLAPAGNDFEARRAALESAYVGVVADEPDLTEEEAARYETDRDRLIELRRKRDEEHKAREEKTKAERAQERAKMGIKTVVEKAQESVAAQGNVAKSYLDDLKLPASKKKRRRRGPRRPDEKGAAPKPPAAGEAKGDGAAPQRRRRRRRRRKNKPPGDAPA